jgi:phosphoribosylglycinamide formyltransferase-1
MPKIVVLISGGGSNLQSIIDSVETGRLDLEIRAVIADRPAEGLKRAEKYNIPAILVDKAIYKKELSNKIDGQIPADTDLIVCAGYLSIISKEFTEKWKNKIINIHPSLLPKFGGKGMYGMNVHKAVIEAGEKESGCTVHYVNAGIDTGEPIAVAKVPVYENDSPEELQKRVLNEEHRLLVEAIKKVLNI